MTDTSHQLPNPPSIAEIAALTARLRELSTAGRDTDPAARAEFLADKHGLLDRIAAAEDRTPGRERYPEPQERHAALSRADAADRLVAYGHSQARARELITDYLRETSERIGVPIYQWGLDQGDVEAIASRSRVPAQEPPLRSDAADQPDTEWATDEPIPYVLTEAAAPRTEVVVSGVDAVFYSSADIDAIADAYERGDHAEVERLHAGRPLLTPDRLDQDEHDIARLECPECGEDAVEQPPEVAVPYAAHGQQVPSYAHPDGEPLCPVIGASGYEPAQPREVLAGPLDDEIARRAQLTQWHADDTAAEAAAPSWDRDGDGWADS